MTELDKLNIDQQAVLESLVNPLEEQEDAKYDLDEDIQRHILGMVMTDRYFMVQSLGLIQSKYFVNIAHQCLHEAVTGFFERYKAMPHKFYIRQELSKKAKNEDQQMHFLAELDAIAEYYVPGVEHREFFVRPNYQFCQNRSYANCI